MKAILMSIQPKWCELIASGEKTIEVRKTAPKLETPFKVYVYQTKHKGKSIVSEALNTVYGGGKVIGSFVCNSATCCQAYYGEGGEKHLTNTFGIDLKRACLTEDELFNYIIGKHGEIGTGWLWHILMWSKSHLHRRSSAQENFYRSSETITWGRWRKTRSFSR